MIFPYSVNPYYPQVSKKVELSGLGLRMGLGSELGGGSDFQVKDLG